MLERQNPRSLRAFPEMIRRRSGGVARNRHGGAPRGERVMHASHDARRVSHTRLTRAFTGATTTTRCALRRSTHPSVRGGEAKLQTPGAKMHRGNEKIWAV